MFAGQASQKRGFSASVRCDDPYSVGLGDCEVQVSEKRVAKGYAQSIDIDNGHKVSRFKEVQPRRGNGQTVEEELPWSALQTDPQGRTGTMLKSADDAHAQLLPSRCEN